MTVTDSSSPALQQLQSAVLAMPMARTLGLRFVHAAPGTVELEMPIQDAFCFRPGQLQATALFALGDFAAVSAAGSLLPPGWANATVDGSVKLFAPARGSHVRARGRVVDAGRLLSICAADLYAVAEDGSETPCATWLGTARNLEVRPTQA
ncbi:MAG: PaaI family thioesterase [Acidovorax sp.]|nr:PaaI family thioesterase [Acidovorax sp.]